jgi:arsenite methyltransferase
MEDHMDIQEQERIRQAVRARYGQVAASAAQDPENTIPQSGCCGAPSSPESRTGKGCGCGSSPAVDLSLEKYQLLLGYSKQDLDAAPQGANLGLGCGNPVALGSLLPGETVVDLGSGGGFDCFLSAAKVGPRGQVIGVDMTPDMITKARLNARQLNVPNVEFRLGEIEHLPVADNCADIIMSNCVINLSVDKQQVYSEAMRVLKPGGRLAISDIVATRPLPPEIQKDLALISACVGGAATIDDTRQMLEDAGFTDICIDPRPGSAEAMNAVVPGSRTGQYVLSADIKARKPAPAPLDSN